MCSLQRTGDLEQLFKLEPFQLQLLCELPSYQTFPIPKRDGSQRWIEDPNPPLKKIQRSLNLLLQGVYYFHRTDAAYGFLVNASDDSRPRTILTNARQHIGKKYLLNVDLEDFFHQIKTERVIEIFERPPFRFPIALAEKLGQLTTYKGRLPMGAPTSPILSNFAAIGLDEELIKYTHEQLQGKFTRYADDMVFSCDDVIDIDETKNIWSIIESHGFVINKEKVRFYAENDPREVTGLRLTDCVELAEDYIPMLHKEIEKLHHVMEVHHRFKTLQSTVKLKEVKQMIKGHIGFARMILGEESSIIQSLRDKYENACNPPDDFMSASWLEFNYI